MAIDDAIYWPKCDTYCMFFLSYVLAALKNLVYLQHLKTHKTLIQHVKGGH